MTQDADLTVRRLALAHLRLVEAGDVEAAEELLEGLDVAELREVLREQTRNVGLLFELVFAGDVVETVLPGLAAEYGRSRKEITDDYLELLIMRFAVEEVAL